MGKEQPLVSIVMPVHNNEKDLHEAIGSVLSQTYDCIELLLVDDGSTDCSGAICDEYAQRDSRIQVFHTKNRGVSHARNKGLNAARGEWVFFMDGDDALAADALDTLIGYADQSDVVIGMITWFPAQARAPICIPTPKNYTSFRELVEDYLSVAYFDCLYSACAKLYRNTKKPSMQFDETVKWAEDMLFNLEYLPYCQNIRVIPDEVYRYRQENASSLSRRFYFGEPAIRIREYKDYAAVLGEVHPAMRCVARKFVYYMYNYFARLCMLSSKNKAEKMLIINYWLDMGVGQYASQGDFAKEDEFQWMWKCVQAHDAEGLYAYVSEKVMNSDYCSDK